MDARTAAVGAVGRLDSTRSRVGAGIGLALVALLGGCQVDPNMQLAEQELRMQDSRIFDLESHLADCHAANDAFRREIASLRRRLDNGGSGVAEKSDVRDLDSRLRPSPPGDLSLPSIEEDEPASPLGEPRLDAPEPFANPLEDAELPEEEPPLFREEVQDPDGEPIAPADEATGSGVSLPEGNDPPDDPGREELPPPRLTGASEEIEQIGLRLAVRYHAEPNVPVEILTLVEPQDASERQVPAAGQVSLMVVEAETTEGTELARWEYSPDASQDHWRNSRLGTGMQFRLPWPGSPRPGQYRLWARFVGEDGRKHLGSVDFEVDSMELARQPSSEMRPQIVPPSEGPLLARAPEQPQVAEEQPKSPPSTVWRASVEAANLPPLARPDPLSKVADARGAPEDASMNGLVPWSPERPLPPNSAIVEKSEPPPTWSPYR